MKILIACEFSGTVREAFRKTGHDAWSCDLLPTDVPGQHIQGDVRVVFNENWDMIIAHPECRFLSVSGMHWTRRGFRDQKSTDEAIQFFMLFANHKCPRIAIENPISIMSTVWRKPDQIIQPYEFGHDASKKTCLWLKGLPKLKIDTANYIAPRIVNGKKRWSNQTDSGQNKLAPSEHRSQDRAKTYAGIASAMAQQWGKIYDRNRTKTKTGKSKR